MRTHVNIVRTAVLVQLAYAELQQECLLLTHMIFQVNRCVIAVEVY